MTAPEPHRPNHLTLVGDTDLSARQRAILTFLRDYQSRYGWPPSLRDIGAAVGLSSASSVAYHLGRLQVKGAIKRDPCRPRCVRLVEPDDTA